MPHTSRAAHGRRRAASHVQSGSRRGQSLERVCARRGTRGGFTCPAAKAAACCNNAEARGRAAVGSHSSAPATVFSRRVGAGSRAPGTGSRTGPSAPGLGNHAPATRKKTHRQNTPALMWQRRHHRCLFAKSARRSSCGAPRGHPHCRPAVQRPATAAPQCRTGQSRRHRRTAVQRRAGASQRPVWSSVCSHRAAHRRAAQRRHSSMGDAVRAHAGHGVAVGWCAGW